jgi:hypothetical protein
MLISDLQILCLTYLDILNYEKNDIIKSFASSNLPNSNCKKVYDIYYIWYKNSKHEIKEYNNIWANRKEWYVNDKLHRGNNLPAMKYKDGTKKWYKNGKLHRDNDLPAIIYYNDDKEWWYNGEVHRDNDLPACEYKDGTKKWYKNGNIHRDHNLPAIVRFNGDKLWYQNGELHLLKNGLPGVKNGGKMVKDNSDINIDRNLNEN